MLTRKPCKYCKSLWHSKTKCPQKPLHAFKNQKRTQVPLSPQKPSERLRTRLRGTSERSQLVNAADRCFSLYIRQRGSDGVGNHCFTCDVYLPIEDLQNGHFMARRYYATRWHPVNCWPQCNDCNSVKHGNLVIYEKKLRAKFGNEAIDELKQLARSGNKVTSAEIQGVIDKYST
jgi:hypothetical protein